MSNHSPENLDNQPSSSFAVKAIKVMGGTALGAVVGYASAKGFEQIVDINSDSIGLYETVVTGSIALMGAFVASESVE